MARDWRRPSRSCGARTLADTLGLSVCAAAVARQVQRLGRWLGGEYEHLKTRLRSGQVAYADETGHRDDGRNGWLWTIGDERHTLYHVDKSGGGKVIRGLLGEAFGGTLVCDFYGGYDAMNCRKQRCNTHLLRELRDTAKGGPAFASHPFHRHCKRLVKDLLSLKRRWEELLALEAHRFDPTPRVGQISALAGGSILRARGPSCAHDQARPCG